MILATRSPAVPLTPDPAPRRETAALRRASLLALLAIALAAPRAAAITPTSAILEWSAPGDNAGSGTATSYQIRYGTAAIGADTTVWWNAATAVASPPAPAPAGTLQSVTLSGLAPSTTYRALLLAFDEAGNRSPYSNVATWTTPTDSVVVVISNITTETTPGVLAITIRWQTDVPATSQVEYGLTTSYGSLTPFDGTLVTAHAVTIAAPNITNDQTYNYRVKSRAAVGPVVSSANRTFKVDAVSPSRVIDLTAR